MATFFKQVWLFKSWTNFSIGTMFISGSGYFYFRHQNDKKFEHPVFKESLRIMEQNSQVIDLIGFPIYIDTGLKSRATLTDKILNSSFPVKGPRGYLNVELAGEAKPQQAIESSLERAKSGELSDEARISRLSELEDYYIADPELLAEIDKIRSQDAGKLEKMEIPPNAVFWKIDYLYVDVSRDYRIVMLPRKEEGAVKIADHYKPNVERKTLKQVYDEEVNRFSKRRQIEDAAATEEEIEELRKFRMQETYKKVGYVRFYMGMIIIAVGMTGYILLQKYKRKNVLGTVIHNQAMNYIKKNEFVTKELGRNLRFLQAARGAEIDGEADFEIDALGEKRTGTFRVKGSFDNKKKDWDLKTIEVVIKGKKGEEIKRQRLL